MTIKTVIEIRETVDTVFKGVINPRLLTQWIEGLERLTPVKGRRPSKGSISTQVFKDAKGKLEVKEEVLYYEKNKEFQIQLSHKNMVSVQTFEFLNQGDSTRLILTTNVRLIPAFIGIFAPIMKGQMRKRQEGDLFRLKHLLEKTT